MTRPSQANRGMSLENLVNRANEQYRARGVAVIHKRPTPIKVHGSRGTQITKAFFEAKSTVDYQGVYRGHALEFEAKSTKEKTRFPLDNLHAHQVEHLRSCMAAGAICFVVLEFTARHEIYFVPGKMVVNAWDAGERGGRKSIPYEDIQVMCYRLESGRGVVLDYLTTVDELLRQTEVVMG
ncbi:Holliday junction resolvase RecU [Alicyclobacillus sp. ALC3]|uniref:Holliday junction resolvase RecU n=1 Tax=Alicyclobacillus sp. ALC3 TaxID=2796143 RepID=UPI002379C8F0|nr:Holliday junction resolvase RecU [Alicyclobacillus sp. ALC3]WDL98148.1 Holliday junction resolvase RecU [Alicyclobacillus sp. ALC3]